MRLSSSRFSAAMGINPYESRAKLWRVMMGLERVEHNERMRNGKMNEFRAVGAVESATGLWFERTGNAQKSILSPCGGFSCTPDGICMSVGLEAKCPVYEPYEAVPGYYLPQIQGQIWICALQAVYFVAWTPQKHRIWLVHRCPEYIEQMKPLLDEFKGYLAQHEEPPRLKRRPSMPEPKIELVYDTCQGTSR